MKHFFIQLSVAVFLLSVFSFRCLGADKYTLEYKLEKGKTYKQRMVTEINMTTDIMGQEVEVDMKSEHSIHYEVIGQNKGIYDVRATYQRIKMDMNLPAPFTIDSDSLEQSSDIIAGNIIKSFVGIPIEFQLTKQGKITSVKGADKLTEILDDAENEQYKQLFAAQFSEQSIQSTFEQMFTYFPNNPIVLNESWDVAKNLNTNGIDLINKMKLTLTQVKNKVATLELTGTVVTPEGGAVLEFQGMDTKISAKGEQAGTMQIDMKTGWIVDSELTQKSVQDIEIMGHTMQQKMEIKTTVTAD